MAKTSAAKKTSTKAKKASPEGSAPAQQPGQTVRVTIKRLINRAAARKTIERLFLKDRTHSDPLQRRSEIVPLRFESIEPEDLLRASQQRRHALSQGSVVCGVAQSSTTFLATIGAA